MNKLIVAMFVLCTILPVAAMETQNVIVITQEESINFAKHLKMAIGFGERVISENKLPKTNPMQAILCKLNNDLLQNDGDIRKLISSDQDLISRIKDYQQVDNHPFVQFGLKQVRNNVGNIDEAKKFIARFRSLSSDLKLAEMYPDYSNPWMGEIQREERINFMLRNAEYPLTDAAIKDYTYMFIYQLLFAQKMD